MIIAEIGQAHEGSLGIAHSYIEALKDTGVDAVKFQTHIAEAESSKYEPFRVNFSYEDKTRYGYWKRMEFTLEQWKGLKHHCDEAGLEFISSPFSNAAVDLLEEVGILRYKVGSGEVNNFLLLEKIAITEKPVILSSGMSSYIELDRAVSFLRERNVDYSILQCTTSYPTKPHQWGLNVIQELRERYSVPVGFSDHSGNIYACLAAAALGADIFEFHITFSKEMFGPDSFSSLNLEQIKMLVVGIKEIRESLNNYLDKSDNSEFSHLKNIFEKSLSINKNLKEGHVISFDDLEAKKPKGKGLAAQYYQDVIGRRLKNTKVKWDFIGSHDLED